MPQPPFKLPGGEPEPESEPGTMEEEDSPCTEEGGWDFYRNRTRRGYHHTGWARTGLEPVVMICIKDAPFDALIDMSANYSMIDAELCRYLNLKITPFQYDIPLCTGIEGACMTRSIVTIFGWVELEVGIPSLGLVTVRLWVADTMSCKGTPFILGSNQIQKIFSQVDIENIEDCPQPWKGMHYRYVYGDHWCEDDSDDLFDSDAYDSDDSFDLLCKFESQLTPSSSHASLESWMQKIEYPDPIEGKNDSETGEKVLQGIADSESESDVNGNPIPAAKVEPPLLGKAEEPQNSGGGVTSVFTNLASESEGHAAEAEFPPCNCNLEVPAPPVDDKVELPSHPNVSCRITPQGEVTLNLQWTKK